MRDVLPLPLPATPHVSLFEACPVGRSRRQQRHMLAAAAAREVWLWLTITGLNYEHGRGKAVCETKSSQLNASQVECMKFLQEAVAYFVCARGCRSQGSLLR